MLNNYTSWSIEIRFGAGFAMIEGTSMEEVFQWFLDVLKIEAVLLRDWSQPYVIDGFGRDEARTVNTYFCSCRTKFDDPFGLGCGVMCTSTANDDTTSLTFLLNLLLASASGSRVTRKRKSKLSAK